MRRDHILQVEHTAGDGVFKSYRDRLFTLGNQWTVADYQNGILALTTATGTITDFNVIGASDIQVGDELRILVSNTNATARSSYIIYFRVKIIESNNKLSLEGHGSAVDITAADNTGIQIVYRWTRPTSARARVAFQAVDSATTAQGSH